MWLILVPSRWPPFQSHFPIAFPFLGPWLHLYQLVTHPGNCHVIFFFSLLLWLVSSCHLFSTMFLIVCTMLNSNVTLLNLFQFHWSIKNSPLLCAYFYCIFSPCHWCNNLSRKCWNLLVFPSQRSPQDAGRSVLRLGKSWANWDRFVALSAML